MTATATKKPYKITFIFDTRGREETIEQLIEEIGKELASLDIEVKSNENLGRKDFARTPDVNITAGNYVQFAVDGPADTSARMQEHFRLNKLIHRIFVQNV